jgi:hypothetical protein
MFQVSSAGDGYDLRRDDEPLCESLLARRIGSDYLETGRRRLLLHQIPARPKPGGLCLAIALLGLLLLLEDESVSLIGDFGQNRQVVAAKAFGLLP